MNSCKSVLSFADISYCHTVHPFLYNNFLQFSISYKACQGFCVILETIFYIFSPRFSYSFHKAGVYFSHSQKPKTKFYVKKICAQGSGHIIRRSETITSCSDFDCFSAVLVSSGGSHSLMHLQWSPRFPTESGRRPPTACGIPPPAVIHIDPHNTENPLSYKGQGIFGIIRCKPKRTRPKARGES